MKLRAIVPAAGKGTRMNNPELPKAMHPICGKPLLDVALSHIDFIAPEDIYLVVGYRKEKIMEHCGDRYHYVEQEKQLGTGHAVAVCAKEFEGYDGDVLIVFGDMPMYHKESLEALCHKHAQSGASCTIMEAINDDLPDWGKMVRDENGRFFGIIEAKDCTPEQAKTTELFSGVMIFRSRDLFATLPELSNQNAQGEYYLTELPKLMMAKGMDVQMFMIPDGDDIRGVNTLDDLAVCEEILKKRNEF